MAMERVQRALGRQRQIAIPLILVIYACLVVLDAHTFFSHRTQSTTAALLMAWSHLGFSALAACLFLAVGTLVWLYAKDRVAAWILWSCCVAMMISFAVSPAAKHNDPTFSLIGVISSGIAIALVSLLLLCFPYNFLLSTSQKSGPGKWILWGYLTLLTLFVLVITPGYGVWKYMLQTPLPLWLYYSYYSLAILAVLGTMAITVVTYRTVKTRRQRQQLRIFAIGVILALIPVMVLTVLPHALQLPERYVIDSQISTISLVLLPLSLGYSVLRYEIMLFDTSIRKAAIGVVASIGIALLIYVVILVFGLLHSAFGPSVIVAVIVAAVASPLVWEAMSTLVDRFFFAEQRLYRRTVERPDLLVTDKLDLARVSHVLAGAVKQIFEAPVTCLFVLNSVSGRYDFIGNSERGDISSPGQQEILRQLDCKADESGSIWLDEQHPIIQQLLSASRPLLMSEVLGEPAGSMPGITRYLSIKRTTICENPLIAPIRASGEMIGILVAGARGDHQQYAGIECETMYLLQARLASVLETARLANQINRRVETMTALCCDNGRSPDQPSPAEMIIHHVQNAASVLHAHAELWLYNQEQRILYRQAYSGKGPELFTVTTLHNIQRMDLQPYFSSRSSQRIAARHELTAPPCLLTIADKHTFPYAWLPLECKHHMPGVFVLSFPSSHVFSCEEQRDLLQLANKYAAEIDHASMTLELQAKLNRQNELDQLKDEFIITNSHELRTLLTLVQGYLELLGDYSECLNADERRSFIASANSMCHTLLLMGRNVMDTARSQTEQWTAESTSLRLSQPIKQIVEILTTIQKQQKKTFQVEVEESLWVQANDLRLKQILLNVVTNACKYSPPDSSIAISAKQWDTETIIVQVRDQGEGIPPEDQTKIFERFVRLKRDLNSSVKGVGLGLFLSKQLVETMGGKIWVESTGVSGEGCTFCFTLKAAPVPFKQTEEHAQRQ